jgi:hypothetical protein
MNALVKLGVVLAGYAAALLVAFAAVHVRQLQTQGEQAQASAGMYAFGDFVLFVVVLGVLALFPTALALYFLRPVETFWTVFAIASLVVAFTGPVAALVNTLLAVLRVHQPIWGLVAFLGLVRVAGAPFLAVGCLSGAVISPARRARWALLAAAVVETVVFACAVIVFLVWPRGW